MSTTQKNPDKGPPTGPLRSVEVTIHSQRFLIKAEESEEHLAEVAEMVRRKVEGIRKKLPTANLQKASMLAAIDFASELIKNKKRSNDYRAGVLNKAESILEKVESELKK
jgi:cell division protein ZapA (FtsZ GTPase activity inhibitor)